MNSQKSVKSKNFRSPIHKAELNILFTGNWLFEKVTALLKPYGISEQQYHVLKILKGKKGIPVNLQYLNDRMIYKMSNTTRLVEKLRLGEYLERSLCEHNRRMVEITITEEGLELNLKYDLVIIGGGPIGLNCAIEAKKAGLSYIVLEKGVLVNSLYNFPTNMTFFSTSNLLEIGDVPFIAHSDKPTRKESLEYFRRVKDSWDLNISLYTEVKGMTSDEGVYQIDTSRGVFQAQCVIVATGRCNT